MIGNNSQTTVGRVSFWMALGLKLTLMADTDICGVIYFGYFSPDLCRWLVSRCAMLVVEMPTEFAAQIRLSLGPYVDTVSPTIGL